MTVIEVKFAQNDTTATKEIAISKRKKTVENETLRTRIQNAWSNQRLWPRIWVDGAQKLIIVLYYIFIEQKKMFLLDKSPFVKTRRNKENV